MRDIVWNLAKYGGGLSTREEIINDENIKELMESRLFSGGVEDRFIGSFNEKTKTDLKILQEYHGDTLDFSQDTKFDKTLYSLVHEGRDENLDNFIDFLVWYDSRGEKSPKENSAEETIISRCLFSSILKLSELTDIFSVMVADFSLLVGAKITKDNYQSISEQLDTKPEFVTLARRWASASKIKVWYAKWEETTVEQKRKKEQEKVKNAKKEEDKKKEDQKEDDDKGEKDDKKEGDESKDDKEEEKKEEPKEEDKKEEEEEKIDTTRKDDKEQDIDSKVNKAVEEAKALLIRNTRERAELFLLLNAPEEWSQKEQLRVQRILEKKDANTDAKKKAQKKDLTSQFEKLAKKATSDTCSGALLEYYSQTGTDKEIHRQLEHSWYQGYKRYVGLDILGRILKSQLEEYELANTLMWFMKSIKANYFKVTDYLNNISGCGPSVTEMVKKSFFRCISGVSYQLRNRNDIQEASIQILLEALIWRYDQRDHEALLTSGIIEAITLGNDVTHGIYKSIKYNWGHNILKTEEKGVTLSFLIISILESITSCIFSKSNPSGDKEDAKKDEILRIGQLHEKNPETEALLKSCLAVVFGEFNRYIQNIKNFKPIDWKLFVKERNKQRKSGQVNRNEQEIERLDDELSAEEQKHREQEEEKKAEELENRRVEEAKGENAAPRDFINEIIKDDTEKEMKKLGKIYDFHTMTKLLRMVDVFTSLATLNDVLREYLVEIFNEVIIEVLIDLSLVSQHTHGLIILNIFKNLLKAQFDISIIDKVLENSKNAQVINLLKLNSKFDLSSSIFLKCLFNQLLSIRAQQWSSSQFTSTGAYDLSCGILRLIISVSKDKTKKDFAKQIEKSLDQFLDSPEEYSIEEYDIITSIMEGGEYQGLNIGAVCRSKQKEIFSVVGFVQEWYNLKSSNSDENNDENKYFKIGSNLGDKDYILGLARNKDDFSKSYLALYNPKEVTLLCGFKKSQNSYLLNKEKLDKFIKAMKIDVSPDKSDSLSLTKRCIGMKILVHMIERYGDKINDLFDIEFKNKLVGILMKESINATDSGEKIPADWFEQKLYVIKKLATERSTPLISKNQANIRFHQQVMSLSKPLKNSTKEIYARSVSLKAAMNYGKIEPSMTYKVLPLEEVISARYSEDNVVICESSNCDSTDKLASIFTKCDTIVTSDVDIRGLHKELKAIDKKLSYFKTIVLIDKSEIINFLEILSSDPEVETPSNDDMNLNETFVTESSAFLGFEKSKIRDIIKGCEGDALSKKATVLAQHLEEKNNKKKDKKDKKEDKKEDQGDEWFNLNDIKFDRDNNYIHGYGLNTDPKFGEVVDQLAAYDSGNYSLDQENEKQTEYEIYDKVYKLSNIEVEADYLKTLSSYYKTLCRKCISAFFQELNMTEVLKLVKETSGSLDKFISYILIKGNDAAIALHTTRETKLLEEFEVLVSKLMKTCSENEEFSEMFEIFYKKSIIKHNIDLLTSAIRSKNDNIESLYGNETVASKTLNILILPNILDVILKTNPDFLYNESSQLHDLISMLFLVNLTFRTEFKLQKSIYLMIYKLLLPIATNPENYSNEIKEKLLKVRIFQRMVDKCKFDITVSSGNRLTPEQKLLFEIFSVFHRIDMNMSESWSLYTYTDTLLELEKSKVILREGKGFDMISYLMYFNNELSGPQQHTKVYAETFHKQFKTKISSKVNFEGFKKMTFRFDEASEIDPNSFIGISSDPVGESILKKFSYEDLKSNKSVDIYSNQCYLHYPYSPPRILGMGENYNYELGQDSSNSYDKAVEMVNFSKKVKELINPGNFTIVLTEEGELFYTGYKSSFEKTNQVMTKYHKKLPEGEIKFIDSAGTTIILVMDDGKIYFEGYDYGYHHTSMYGEEKYLFVHKKRPDEEEEDIIDLSVGKDHHAYITDSGKLYVTGNTALDSLNIPQTNDSTYKLVELGDGVVPKRVLCSSTEETEKPFLVLVEVEGKTELWSGGKSRHGALGQGEGINISEGFKPVDYDREKITFKDFSIFFDTVVAVTTDGELYGWGQNDDKQLGIAENKDFYSPQKISHFEDKFVHEAQVGRFHSVIKVSSKDDKEKFQYYNLGNNNGCKNDGKTDDGLLHMEQFDNHDVKFWSCGKRTTYFIYDGEEFGSEGVGVHHGYTCDYTKQSPIVGTMHFYQDSDKGWHFLSKEGYEASKDDLPDIVYATKYHIDDIQGKEWPEFDSNDLLEESKENQAPLYISSVKVNGEKVVPNEKSSEKEIFEKATCDMNPLIFFRISRPLKDDKSLPELELEKYHEKTENFGIKIEADPDYSFMKNDLIMALESEKYQNLQNRINTFDAKHDEELMKQIENNLEMQQQNFVECPYVFLMAGELEFEDQALRQIPTDNVQSRIDSLVMFNQYLLKSLPFLYFDEGLIHKQDCGETQLETESLTACFIEGKKFALESIKKNYLKTISDGLPTDYSTPTVDIDTAKLKKWYDEGVCDTMGENTMFGKMFKKLKEKKFENLRIQASTNYGWYANFQNEGVSNDGSYRKCQSWMVDELLSSFLPLFVPTKNNKEKTGEFQDRWIINPASTSSLHLDMYRFVGALIAKAFRSGHVMDFRFTSLFWKKFVCDPLTLEDLEQIDEKLAKNLAALKNKDEDALKQKLNFTTELSDGTVVDLKENGEEEFVNAENVEEYVRLVLNKRLGESVQQMDAIKQGFDVVFPSEVARILSWQDLESRVRGDEFDIDKLKGITDYSDMSADDEWGTQFWNIIKSFSLEEQTRYLRCVGGRTRLPPEPRLSEVRHKVYIRDQSYYSEHDENEVTLYPESFNIYLNRFSSEEIMRKKILEAIEHSERYCIHGKGEKDSDVNLNNADQESNESRNQEVEESDESGSDESGTVYTGSEDGSEDSAEEENNNESFNGEGELDDSDESSDY